MDSDNYPECCHAIYIVNAGAAFSAIWRLLSPFVDKGTRDKVHVLGNAKASQVSVEEHKQRTMLDCKPSAVRRTLLGLCKIRTFNQVPVGESFTLLGPVAQA